MEKRSMPVTYSSELAAIVCERIARGETASQIARSAGMPSRRTLFEWRRQHADFALRYSQAMAARAGTGVTVLGRPTGYSTELAAAICGRVMAGQTLRRICASEGMPPLATLMRWLKQYPDFAQQYALAKETQAALLVDETLDIADDRTIDYNDRRISVDTRRWVAAIMLPKKYGGRASVDLAGYVRTLSDEELDRQIRELLAKANGAYDDVTGTES